MTLKAGGVPRQSEVSGSPARNRLNLLFEAPGLGRGRTVANGYTNV